MTREQAKELLPVIQAYADKREIQVCIRDCCDDWEDYQGNSPEFNNPTVRKRWTNRGTSSN